MEVWKIYAENDRYEITINGYQASVYTTITIILKEAIKFIFPTLIKLAFCENVTSKIETIKEFGSSVDMDDTIDSLLEDLNLSLSSSQWV